MQKLSALAISLMMVAIPLLAVIPLERAYSDEVLSSLTIRQSNSKVYSWKEFGQSRSATITLQAETNGTINVFYDSQLSFKIRLPSGLAGALTTQYNSTYYVNRISVANFFVEMKWKLNARDFKLDVCWNLPSAITVSIPISKAKRFLNNIIDVDDRIKFDWNDAVKEGFNVNFNNSTKVVSVAIPASGCLDPTLKTTNMEFATGTFGGSYLWESQGLRWAFSQNTSGLYYNYSSNGVSWSAGSKLRNGDASSYGDVYDDGNAFHIVWNAAGSSFHYLQYTHTSSGTVTLQTEIQIYLCGGNGCGRPKITVNSTGFPMVVGTDRATAGDERVVLLRSRTSDGTSWFNATVPNVSGGGTDTPISDICSIGSGNLLVVFYKSGEIRARQFYQSNSSIGGNQTLATGATQNIPVSCSVTNNNVAHVFFYQASTTRYRYVNRTSPTVSSTVINVGPSSGIRATSTDLSDSGLSVGLNKNTNNSLFITILGSADLTIYYLHTSSNLAFIVNASRSGGAGVQDFVSVSGFYTNNASIGYLTTQGAVSPFDVVYTQFDSVSVELLLRIRANDATTNIQSLNPICRFRDTGNGTVSRYTASANQCVSRVRVSQNIEVAISLNTNNSAFIKVNGSNTITIASGTSDSSKTISTSVYINTQLRSYTDDGSTAPLRLNWIQIRWNHNSTTTNTTLTSTAQTFPLWPQGNASNLIHKIAAFSASSTVKNNIRPNATTVNATANSQAFSVKTSVGRKQVQALDNGASALASANIKIKLGNQSALLSLTANSTGYIDVYLQNDTRSNARIEVLDNTVTTYNATRDLTGSAQSFSVTTNRFSNFATQTGKNLVVSANYTVSAQSFSDAKYNWTLTAPAGLNVGTVSWQLFSFSSTPLNVYFNDSARNSPSDWTYTSSRVNLTSTNRGMNGKWFASFGTTTPPPAGGPPAAGQSSLIVPLQPIQNATVVISAPIALAPPQFDNTSAIVIIGVIVIIGSIVYVGSRKVTYGQIRKELGGSGKSKSRKVEGGF